MNPNDLKLSNGLSCIEVYYEDHIVSVVLPEGWKLVVLPTDSGQTLDHETLPTGDRTFPGRIVVRPRRIEPRTKPPESV